MKTAYSPLGDLADVVSGGTPSRSEPTFFDGGIPWVKIGDMLQGTITDTAETISELGLKESSAKLLPAGTLLLSIFATIGRTAVLGIDAATNQAIAGLKIKSPTRVDRNFLGRYLEYTSADLAGQGRGVAQMNINLSILRAHLVPLPPIEEQRRIAAILDAADALRTKRRQALAKLNTLTQAIFIDMFGDPVSNPRNLPVHPLRDLIKLSSGNGLSAKDMKPGPYLVYGGNGVSGMHDQFMYEEPQIVIGRVGVYCGCVHVTEPFSWITDNALYVTRMEAGLNRTYLVEALREANLNQFADQAAQPLISGSRVYPVPILVPSIDEQLRFEKVMGAMVAVQRKLSAGEGAVEALFASLQHRAFRGEL